jgi:hypothetical protein
VNLLVSTTRFADFPIGRTCRSVSWQISMGALLGSGAPILAA